MELEGDDFLSKDETREMEMENEEEGEVMYKSDGDHEVSFAEPRRVCRPNQECVNASNSANGEGNEKEIMNEDLSEEEEQSMMKFTRFLEKKGYLKRDPKPTQMKKKSKGQPTEDKTDRSKNETRHSMSELTVYHEAVPMEFTEINETNSQRLSSSSEDANITSDKNLNASDKICKVNNTKVVKSNELKQVTQRSVIADSKLGDIVTYQNFLDCRLKEQREMIRRRENQNQRQSLQQA